MEIRILARLVTVSALILAGGFAHATDFIVNTAADVVAADGAVSLREALMAANSDAAVEEAPAGAADGDRISFDAAIFGASPLITLAGTPLVITDDIVIDGNLGATTMVLSGGGLSRLFEIDTAAGAGAVTAVTLSALALEQGNSAEGGGAVLLAAGSTATLVSVDFSNSMATGHPEQNLGGAILNNGTLTIEGGTFSGNSAGGPVGGGGAIHNGSGAVLVAAGTTFSGNDATTSGGAILAVANTETVLEGVMFDANSASGTPGNGGALYSFGVGSVLISGGTFSRNTANNDGGALFVGGSTVLIDGSEAPVLMDANRASGDPLTQGGGAIFNNGGTVVLNGDVTLSNNVADGLEGSGGAIYSRDGSLDATGTVFVGNVANRAGGAIETANQHSLTLTEVSFDSNNVAVAPAVPNPGNGGAVHVSGSGAVTVSGGSVTNNLAATQGGGFWNATDTTMSISGSVFAGNVARGEEAGMGGGALYNQGTLTLSESVISGNSAAIGEGSGGGIFNDGGTLAVDASTVELNLAARAGGGIEDRSVDNPTSTTLLEVSLRDNSAGPMPGNGGGLHVSGGASTVTFDRSTASGNIADNEGGGLWLFSGSSLTLANATVSGNRADGSGGGGLFSQDGGLLQILNSTVADNATAGSGGGLAAAAGSSASNAVIAGNTAASDADVGGPLTALHTIVGDPGAAGNVSGANNQVGVDPLLGPLADNGGPTLTHGLQEGSPAIDSGDSATCTAPPVNGIDQRGANREAACDIGAFESVPRPMVAKATTISTAEFTVNGGATDVSVLGFRLASEASETIEVSSFSGPISGTADPVAMVGAARLYLDLDGDGTVDAGDTELTGGNGAEVTVSAAGYSVEFTVPRSLAPGAEESYLLAIDIAPQAKVLTAALPMGLAGISGLALLLAFGGLLRRRFAIAAVFCAMLLSACDQGGRILIIPEGGGGGSGSDEPTLQFSLTDIDGRGTSTGAPLESGPEYLRGPVIRIR